MYKAEVPNILQNLILEESLNLEFLTQEESSTQYPEVYILLLLEFF